MTDAKGRPIRLFMTAGEVSDYIGAAAMLSSLPASDWLIAHRGYDADWFDPVFTTMIVPLGVCLQTPAGNG